MRKRITLGSLFDGIGGFPLSGAMCGVEPIWASEIEPFPIAVTMNRFPNMKHLGSVTDIKGDQIEPVDIITFGSPCQDLSVAGKQAGIHDGERSNLFFEAVRIIKEMREHDRSTGRTGFDVRPRFAVWENVPGAFSSGKGKDFQAVLQTLCEVADPNVTVPLPEKGKWNKSGYIVGDEYSIAWRVYDAQYWGVPQRRKRIYLVADFASERAGEILFEREGMRWDSAPSREAWEGTAADAEGSAGRGCVVVGLTNRGYPSGDKGETLRVGSHGAIPMCATFMGGQGAKAGSIAYDETVSPTLRSTPSGTNTTPDIVYCLQANGIDRAETAGCNGCGWREGESYTLNTIDRHAVAFDCRNMACNDKISAILQAKNEGGFSLNFVNPIIHENFGFGKWREGFGTVRASGGDAGGGSEMLCVESVYPEVTGALCANSHPGSYTGQDAFNNMLPVYQYERRYIVRRLTPLECCRLQGYPDGWTENISFDTLSQDQVNQLEQIRKTWAEANGKRCKPCKNMDALKKWFDGLQTDSAEYKAYGNSLAIPCSHDVISRIARAIREGK